MRERFTYDIATISVDGRWTATVIRDDTFSRDPQSIARSLLEQWINDHQGRLPGGRVFVFGGAQAGSRRISATVRVRVYRGDLHDHNPEPVAVAYLGHAESEHRGSTALGHGPTNARRPTNPLYRVRSRLRLPRPGRSRTIGDRRPPSTGRWDDNPHVAGRSAGPRESAA